MKLPSIGYTACESVVLGSALQGGLDLNTDPENHLEEEITRDNDEAYFRRVSKHVHGQRLKKYYGGNINTGGKKGRRIQRKYDKESWKEKSNSNTLA
ncbi:hypothetical protein Tco_1458078 [Tanacetum coccineum]